MFCEQTRQHPLIDFNQTWYNLSTNASLELFWLSRSYVKGQGHSWTLIGSDTIFYALLNPTWVYIIKQQLRVHKPNDVCPNLILCPLMPQTYTTSTCCRRGDVPPGGGLVLFVFEWLYSCPFVVLIAAVVKFKWIYIYHV